MKASCKQLIAILALGVRKLGPTFLTWNLDEFPLFDGFLDLAYFLLFNFPDLDKFFDFSDFLACSILLPSNPPTSP